MKRCSVCDNEYDAWMQFCPRDSSELVAPGADAADDSAAACPAGAPEIAAAAEGRYRKVQLMASTPIGDVYLAEDTFLRRHVTLVVVADELGDGDRAALFFRYRAISRVAHPNVSTVYSLELVDGKPAGVVEHVEGSFLDDLIAAEGPLAASKAAGLARQAALGLEAIHDAGVVHKDIRPANALVSVRGVLKLINFSQALVEEVCGCQPRPIDGLVEKLRWLNPASDPLVELAFTAPEQLRGGVVTAAADIYGVGAVLYAMLAGRPPFRTGSISELVHEIAGVTPSPPPARSSEEAELAGIAMRCLEKDPAARYATAGELAAALDDVERRLLVAEVKSAIEPTVVAAGGPDDPESRIDTRLARPTTAPLTGGSVPPPTELPQPGDVIDGRYRIDAVHGRGGMGAVYRATDVDLERSLAIKVLHPQLLGDETAIRRFRHEARASARLSHPNAVTVYGFGQLPSGAAYIAMEFVEGTTLRDELRRRGRLGVDEAAHLLGQIADAVEAAHRAGLVHRDLKPDNVMLERRPGGVAVKVLDFGIAKLLTASGDTEQLTVPHSIIGTPVYMSPEQARGESVDARSDIYSLGVMLYEMLSGRVPFAADTPVALALKHVTEPPPPIRTVVPDLPETVEAIILSALAKNPDERPPTALDLAHAFWASANDAAHQATPARAAAAPAVPADAQPSMSSRATVAASSPLPAPQASATPTPPAMPGRAMVAVLPLRTLSPDPSDAYFAAGLIEELLTSLARLDGVGVISRTSTERFKSSDEPLPAIGARLGASFVLEGSVRRAGSRVRVAAQLVCVARDTHVWAGTFDRELDDVLAVQSDIADGIVAAIGEHLASPACD